MWQGGATSEAEGRVPAVGSLPTDRALDLEPVEAGLAGLALALFPLPAVFVNLEFALAGQEALGEGGELERDDSDADEDGSRDDDASVRSDWV